MTYRTTDIKEFQAMIYAAVVHGLTFEATTIDDVHKITYTGGF
jgi:hypothetical protein